VSPQVLRSDAMARPYAFLSLMTVLAAGSLWKGQVQGDRRALAAWSVCCVILLYTHNWTVLPVAAMSSVALWRAARSAARGRERATIIASGAVFLAWLPWAPFLAHQAAHGGHLRPETPAILRGLYQAAFVLPGFSPRLSLVFLAALGGMALLSRIHPRDRAQSPESFAALGIGTTLLSLVFAVAVSVRANLLVAPAVRMLSPLFLLSVAPVFTRRAQAGRAFPGFALVLLVLLSGVEAWSSATLPRSNAALMARVVSGAASNDDLVFVVPSPLAASFLRYYTGTAPVEGFPRGFVQRPTQFDDWPGRDTNPRDIEGSASRARQVLKRGGRVWQVATVTPAVVQTASENIDRMMTDLAGPPTTYSDERRRAWPEDVVVRVWSPSR